MEVIHNLLQTLLRLVHAFHVGKFDAVGGLNVDPGVGLAAVEHHGIGAAGSVHELFGHKLPQRGKKHDGQNPVQQDGDQRRGFLDNLPAECRAGVIKPGYQLRIIHEAGFVYLGSVLVGEEDLVVLYLHLADFLTFRHGDKGAIVHLHNLPPGNPGHQQEVEQHQRDHDQGVVVNQRLLWFLYFIHIRISSLSAGPWA